MGRDWKWGIMLFCNLIVLSGLPTTSSGGEGEVSLFQRVEGLYERKRPARPGDWLSVHPEIQESFEDFQQRYRPLDRDDDPRVLYLVWIGPAPRPETEKILTLTAKFLSIYFQRPVRFLPPFDVTDVPVWARRRHPWTGEVQLNCRYLLDEVLIPMKPDDALGLLAFTETDLWPGGNWNFVFGQTVMPEAVAVQSLARLGDPSGADYRLVLRRTLATAAHEAGHMLGLPHCVTYECLMNGSNSLNESDRRPLTLCPIDLRKMTWRLGWDNRKRLEELEDFFRAHQFPEADFIKKVLSQGFTAETGSAKEKLSPLAN